MAVLRKGAIMIKGCSNAEVLRGLLSWLRENNEISFQQFQSLTGNVEKDTESVEAFCAKYGRVSFTGEDCHSCGSQILTWEWQEKAEWNLL